MNLTTIRRVPALVVGMVAVTAVGGGLGPPGLAESPRATGFVAAGPAVCGLRPSGHAPAEDERRSCLSVTATVSRAPALHEQAAVEITVDAAASRPAVEIRVDLPANLRWVRPPAGMTQRTTASRVPTHQGTLRRANLTRAVQAGQQLRYRGVVEAIGTGPAEIDVLATADASAPAETGRDSAFLTVGQTAGTSQLGIVADRTAVAGAGPTGPPLAGPDRRKELSTRVQLPRPAAQAPSGVTDAASAGGTVCAHGFWRYVDHNGVARPGLGWVVKVWDADSSGGNDLLAQDFVGWSGDYNFCFANNDEDGTGQDVFVEFWADAGDWRVVEPGVNTYHFWSSTRSNAADGASLDFGTLQPPAMYMRAAAAFDAVFSAWQTVPGACWDIRAACRTVVIRWTPSSTDGTYYSPGGNEVHLAAADPDSAVTVVHETTHSIMDDVYDDHMPSTPGCNPHTIQGATSAGCAWVEGFAEWFPAIVFNDPFYRWPSGASLNLETPTAASAGWADGDTVEGRVAGALIDLSDANNEGTDRVSEGMANIWSTFQDHNSTTFARFWADRGADGFQVDNNALGSLFQNSIDYGFRP